MLLTKKSEDARCPICDTSFSDMENLIWECKTLARKRGEVLNSLKTGRPFDTFDESVRGEGTEDYQQESLKCLLSFICDAGIRM